ncbi:MAG: cupin domain-containing protein, partial (plasmid) [Pantoea sp. Brub]|nr:cupin domain-containing protein [Pantoea sp. Brub]
HPNVTHPNVTHPNVTHPNVTHPNVTHPNVTHPNVTHPNVTHPDITNPPITDNGTLPNLRYAFSDSHIKKGTGGWTRQVTQRELEISSTIAGVNMRLNKGGIRELHWHKEGEWSYMISGKARITTFDIDGTWYINEINAGDLWYFPAGIPHSIQGLEPDGCEFILAFDNGAFDEESTFLLSDWFKNIPFDILAKTFNVTPLTFSNLPKPHDRYIFAGTIDKNQIINNFSNAKKSFIYQPLKKNIIHASGGTIQIIDSSIFPIAKTIAAAIVEIKPGGLRELHWHPNNDEWQYYLEGTARMGVFASSGQSRTFNYKTGDVGYVPFAMGHYIENIGNTNVKFLELFRSDYYADISLYQWLANTPNSLIKQHLNVNSNFTTTLSLQKDPIIK